MTSPSKTREGRRAYRAANRRKIASYKREYYARTKDENREHRHAYDSAWREAHREDLRGYNRDSMRDWRAQHPEKTAANQKAAYERRKADPKRAEHRKKWVSEYQKGDGRKLERAKRSIHRSTGVPMSKVPDDIADAKARQTDVVRVVRQVRKAGH